MPKTSDVFATHGVTQENFYILTRWKPKTNSFGFYFENPIPSRAIFLLEMVIERSLLFLDTPESVC